MNRKLLLIIGMIAGMTAIGVAVVIAVTESSAPEQSSDQTPIVVAPTPLPALSLPSDSANPEPESSSVIVSPPAVPVAPKNAISSPKPRATDPTPVAPSVPAPASAGNWKLTVYYTPVESYHSGPSEIVHGCLQYGCGSDTVDIGNFPQSFLELVRLEGVGKITSGAYAGRYLHWTSSQKYWLTNQPLDATGKPLVAFKTAAADSEIRFGTTFRITNCGVDVDSDQPLRTAVCEALKAATWSVFDRFGRSDVGEHMDLYIGEEDRPNFLQTHPFILATKNAAIELR